MATPDDPVVLVIEDEPTVAETYRLWLEDKVTVRMAADGAEGLERLDDTVDVVLLDRRMPNLSGDDVLAELRDRGLDCRVAMVTAVEPDFDILEMGFDAYLSKPLQRQTLLETVDTLLERATYASLLQEYYANVEKRATLESVMNPAELERSEEYERLCDEIDTLRDRLADTLDGVEDDEDFIATIRQLGTEN